MIYLFLKDNYGEVVDLSHYATTEQELILLVQKYFEENLSDLVITNCEIDFVNNIIKVRYYDIDFKDIPEYCEFYFIQIPKI